jgi:GntR family transcriptional regulator, rspAB operon transcriptional repressor
LTVYGIPYITYLAPHDQVAVRLIRGVPEMTEAPLSLSKTTLAEQAYEYLLREISRGSLPPGTELRETKLVAQLNVSRTPIREALQRLVNYGLVEVVGRSPRVRRLTEQDVIHIYQVRRALERDAIKLACGRLTPEDFAHLDALVPPVPCQMSPEYEAACFRLDIELHRLIVQRAANPLLAQEIRKLHDAVQLVHQPATDRRGWLTQEVRQHEQIITALKTGDRRAACKAMLDHLRSAAQMQVRCVRAADRDGAETVPSGSAVNSLL